MFWIGKYGFFRLFLEAQKKIIDPQGSMYTKVSWLEGNFSIDLPIRPLGINGQTVTVLATCGYLTESSQLQLRVSGGFETYKSLTPLPLKYTR
jgi:hypothetical protein